MAGLPPNLSSPDELSDKPSLPGIESPFEKKSVAGVGKLVAAGGFWLLLQTLGTKAVSFIGQLVLAGLLSPSDFGKIGMAYTVTAFVSLLINPGVDLILVRRGKRFHLWSTPAFYFSLLTALAGCLIILVAAPIAARFYGVPELRGLLAVLAFATPLGSLILIPTAKLRAEMRFRAIAAVNLVQILLQTLLTLTFAATGFGIYSFVLPVPIVYLVIAAILWIIAEPKIRFTRPLQYWKYLIGDSSYIFGTSLLATLVGQIDYIILGAMYDDVVLGPYFFAFNIATQSIRLTAGSLQLVLMSGLARMSSFSAQQTQAALKATKAISLCGMPLCFIQAVVAGPLLHALYGDKWNAAIPLVQLLSVGMAFDVMSWPAGSLLQSRGQFRFLFFWSSGFVPIFIGSVLLGAFFGKALGVAVAVCAYYTLLSPLLVVCVFRSSGIPGRDVLTLFVRPICVGALSAGATIGVIYLTSLAGAHPAVQCGLSLIIGVAAMTIAARFIMPASFHEILARLMHILAPAKLPR